MNSLLSLPVQSGRFFQSGAASLPARPRGDRNEASTFGRVTRGRPSRRTAQRLNVVDHSLAGPTGRRGDRAADTAVLDRPVF